MNEAQIDELMHGHEADTVTTVLAMSWKDAHEYRSVKQNAGQRKMLIERAIEQYLEMRKRVQGAPLGQS